MKTDDVTKPTCGGSIVDGKCSLRIKIKSNSITNKSIGAVDPYLDGA